MLRLVCDPFLLRQELHSRNQFLTGGVSCARAPCFKKLLSSLPKRQLFVCCGQALDLLCLVGVWQRLPADSASDCRGELLGIGLTNPQEPEREGAARGSESSDNGEFSDNPSTTATATTTTLEPKATTAIRSTSSEARGTCSSKWCGGLVAHACSPNGGRDVKFTIAIMPDPRCLRRLKVSPRLPACNPRVAPVLGARSVGQDGRALGEGAAAAAAATATVGSASSFHSNGSSSCFWNGSGRDGLELRLLGLASASRFGSRSPRCASSLPRSSASSFDSSSSRNNDARKSPMHNTSHHQSALSMRFHVRHSLTNHHYTYARLPGPFPAQDRFALPTQSLEGHSTLLNNSALHSLPQPVGAFSDVLALSAQHHMVQDIPLLASTFRRLHQQPQEQQDQQPHQEEQDQQGGHLDQQQRQDQRRDQHHQPLQQPAVGTLEALRGLWVAPYGSHGLEIVHVGTCHAGLHRPISSKLEQHIRSMHGAVVRKPTSDDEEINGAAAQGNGLAGGFTFTSTSNCIDSNSSCSRDGPNTNSQPPLAEDSAQRHPYFHERQSSQDSNSLEPTEDGEECLRLEGLKVVGDPNVPSGKLSFVVDGSRRYNTNRR